MRRLALTLLAACLSTIIIALSVHPVLVVSQSTDYNTRLNNVIQDVQKAELAGARPEEINGLIVQLNSVVALQDELQNTPAQEADKRAQLTAQINNTLSTVDAQAIQLAAIASQRSHVDHMVTYSSGVVGAVIGTVACYCGILLWQKYRVKRTFRMRIIPKAISKQS
jgi:hypothetical protein